MLPTAAITSPSTSHVAQRSGALSLSPSFTLLPTGLDVRGVPGLAEWTQVGQDLFGLGNATAWAIGDWLVYAEGRGDWGETYSQAIDLTRRSYGSLAQCARVSQAFNFEARFKTLSWSHHQAVLSLPPDERHALLQRSESEQWNRDDLREHLRQERVVRQTAPRHLCPKCGWRW